MARSPTKDIRWNVRVASVDDELVRRAAALSSRNLSDFVLQAARIEAERVLADRTRFVLDEQTWAEFADLLDRPTKVNSGLAKLLTTPSLFE